MGPHPDKNAALKAIVHFIGAALQKFCAVLPQHWTVTNLRSALIPRLRHIGMLVSGVRRAQESEAYAGRRSGSRGDRARSLSRRKHPTPARPPRGGCAQAYALVGPGGWWLSLDAWRHP